MMTFCLLTDTHHKRKGPADGRSAEAPNSYHHDRNNVVARRLDGNAIGPVVPQMDDAHDHSPIST
jgi:hypothetical protein